MKKHFALLMAAVLAVSSLTACNSKEKTEETTTTPKKEAAVENEVPDTIIIGTTEINEEISSVFQKNALEDPINNLVFTSVCRLDENGELTDWAGHIDTEEIQAEDGHTQIKYTIKLKDGMKFSDGEPVTADDLLFYYQVLADPTYEGTSEFSSLDIVGMKEYYYDTPNYSERAAEIEANYAMNTISRENFKAYLVATNCEGWFDGELPGDVGDGRTWKEYLESEGYDASGISTAEDMLSLLADCEYEHYADDYDPLSYYRKEYIKNKMASGVVVETISGIEKTDDLTCTILFDSPCCFAERQLALMPIVPKHYYESGWKKGDLSGLEELNKKPVGSGPYVFSSFENGTADFVANTDYFMRTPSISNVEVRTANENEMYELVSKGELDIAKFVPTLEIQTKITNDANVEEKLFSNSGYGYIGINAERISDINMRKGLMHVMNRSQAVATSFGELANVLERPMSEKIAEYPKNAQEYYGYDLDKALEYFIAGGYEQIDGKLSKNGDPLAFTVSIADAQTHPLMPLLTQMAEDLESIGAELVIDDVQFDRLRVIVEHGETDLWAMAWGNMENCDLTEIFGSNSDSNFQCYNSDELDTLLKEIIQTMEFDGRCQLVEQELDMIMDAAVCMPVYQRKTVEIYNKEKVDTSLLPGNPTAYWNDMAAVEFLKIKDGK